MSQTHFVALCILWYLSATLTNNFNKQLMNVFPYPVSVVLIKFGSLLIITSVTNKRAKMLKRIHYNILICLLPTSFMQILGHLANNTALEFATVSFLHAVKATTPLFTIIICRLLGDSFSTQIYLSLIPLTLGVMLVCATEVEFQLLGLVFALSSTLIFVMQNIFYKHLFDSKRHPRKILLTSYVPFNHNIITWFLDIIHSVHDIIDHTAITLDKINVMFYSCFVSFCCLLPYWLYSLEYVKALQTDIQLSKFLFLAIMTGIMHTIQSLVAFTIIDRVSAVSYSIASLFKRIVVIAGSFLWFKQEFQLIQGFGFVMTFGGLYLYQVAKQNQMQKVSAHVHSQ
eukprot:NODE_61_length_25240_cov_0.547194.p9 type:complete len:342 gc:universal NODE_61_length_25240_cov_0.547194:1598-573(-)